MVGSYLISQLSVYTLFSHLHHPRHTLLHNKKGLDNSHGEHANKPRSTIKSTIRKWAERLTKTIWSRVWWLMSKKITDASPEWKDTVIIRPESPQEYLSVIRNHTVISVGDLHGNYGALLGNLNATQMIDSSGNWTWGDTKMVFHGDIFADRYPDSMHIASHITQLQEEARSQGGEIMVLAWNHEDIAFAFLTGHKLFNKGKLVDAWGFKSARTWLQELRQYVNGIDPEWSMLDVLRSEPGWRVTLEFMCNMKLVEKIDDTLFIHVMPNAKMIQLILKRGIDGINTLYQRWMRTHLLWNEKLSPNEHIEFHNLRSLFLDTEHRESPPDEI
jgi:hypothetical protein